MADALVCRLHLRHDVAFCVGGEELAAGARQDGLWGGDHGLVVGYLCVDFGVDQDGSVHQQGRQCSSGWPTS